MQKIYSEHGNSVDKHGLDEAPEREEDPTTWKFLEGGTTFLFSLHAKIGYQVEKEKSEEKLSAFSS